MICKIKDLKSLDISALSLEGAKEGYNIINHLVVDYTSGENRFNNRGEMLIGFIPEDEIVAICGVNISNLPIDDFY